MKKINFLIVLVILIVVINSPSFANQVLVSHEDMSNGYVIVKEGWTLSSIAKAIFGDYNKYRDLMKYNNIQDGDDIRVGQKIYLLPRMTEVDKINIASEVIKNRIKRRFKIRYKRNYSWDVSRRWAYDSLSLISNDSPTPIVRGFLDEIKARLEWHDAVSIYRTIYKVSKNVDEMIYLTSIVETESNFRNVNGSHGEIGPCQIKPTTGYCVYRKIYKNTTVEEVSSILTDVVCNVEIGYLLIKKYLKIYKGDKVKALKRYNAGSNRNQYARKIMKKYHAINFEFNKKIQEKF